LAKDVKFGVREHVFEPGPGQAAGCAAGQPAAACLAVLAPGAPRVVKATAGGEVALTVLHEPLPGGAYLLGELSKFVHTSPQRFAGIVLGGSSPCGFRCDDCRLGPGTIILLPSVLAQFMIVCSGCSAQVLGAPHEVISVVAVDSTNTVRVSNITILANGTATVAL
jgi:hypothetical protein